MLNIGLIALGSGGLAQVVKMVLGSLRGRRLRWALLFANGGMPIRSYAEIDKVLEALNAGMP